MTSLRPRELRCPKHTALCDAMPLARGGYRYANHSYAPHDQSLSEQRETHACLPTSAASSLQALREGR